MPRFAANVSLLYAELPFLDRYAAAAADGFGAVECQLPYTWPAGAIAEVLAANRLRQVLINAPAGDHDAGERGLACLPGREDEFEVAVERALAYATELGCPRVHVMAGIAPAGSERERLRQTYLANLRRVVPRAADAGVELLIEPINPLDMPGYFLNRQDDAHAIVEAVGSKHLKVQMDLYHCRLVEGDVESTLRTMLPSGRVGHLQIAGAPGRHEPDTGELDHEPLFALIDSLGYAGWIGCEYRPAGATSRGLGWLRGRQRESASAAV